jgi:hypothetical protein
MLRASTPPRFNIAFAAGAGGGFIRAIPQASQIGIQGGAASLTDGFPPLNFQPVAAGGVPPFGEDFNGILNQITLWSQWFEAGAPIYYDATFASGASGGYPQGAIIQSSVVLGDFWMSTADNNTTNPDSTGSANWVPDPSRIAPGTPVPSFSSTVPTGFVACNTLTIGNGASNATGRANGDTLLAYRSIWMNFSNTACPIFTSTGAASTRGANPDADFNANKALSTPDMRGRGLIGIDTMLGPTTTRLVGVPVTLGSSTAPASVLGENLHSLVGSENGSHIHANFLSDPGHLHGFSSPLAIAGGAALSGNSAPAVQPQIGNLTQTNTAGANITLTNASSGSGSGHNTVSQNITVFWNLKL